MKYYGFSPFIRAYHDGKEGVIYDLLDGSVYRVLPEIVMIFCGKTYCSYKEIKENAMKFYIKEKDIKNIIKEGLDNGVIVEVDKDYWRNEMISPIESQARREEFIFSYKKISLQPTGRCTEECDFCNIFLNCCCFKEEKEWSDTELKNILKELERFKGMIEEIEIWGGNPLLYSKIEKLVIGLNKIKPGVVNVNIPLGSSILGEESKILKLKNICRTNFIVTFLVFYRNWLNLSIIPNMASNYKIKLFIDNRIDKLAEIKDSIKNFLISKVYLLRKNLTNLNWYKDVLKTNFLEGVIFHDFYFRKNFHRCWGCSIAIDFNGNIKPCLWSYYKFGNWKEGKIMHVLDDLKNTELFWLDVNLGKIEKCQDCIYRFGCKDCRVITEALCRNIKAKNPLCPIT